MSTTRVGILGSGRLGKALALRLRETCEVAIYDVNVKLSKQFAKQNGMSFLYEDELYSFCHLLILCIPASETEKVVLRLDARDTGVSMVLNTATSLSTPEVIRTLGLRRTKLIGFKPIGQFAAIQRGVSVVFVTEHSDSADLNYLSSVFSNIGVIRRGDEMAVQALNREATRLALRFGSTFLESIDSLAADPEWRLSALRACAGGTILDYPPDPGNSYTSALLEEMDNNIAVPVGAAKEDR